MSDPVIAVWDVLARDGYGPHGKQHDFRARCPGHGGSNPTSLHVSEDAEGNALLHCFAHNCSAETICERLGISLADLFVPGAPVRRGLLRDARRSEFDGRPRVAANVLLALAQLGVEYRVEITTDCPRCRSPHASLTVATWIDHVHVQCPRGCSEREFTEALAGRLADRQEAA